MKRIPKILVVGSLVMDLIVLTERFPDRGETVLGTGFQTASGGKGANQAVQAARLGAQVTMVGKTGQDDFGSAMIKSLGDAGIRTNHILRTDEASSAIGNVQVESNEGGTANRIIVVSGANMLITPRDVAFLKDSIGDYDMVLLQHEIPQSINELVVGYAVFAQVPVMLNTAPYAQVPEHYLSQLSFISPNEHEASHLSGIDVKDMDSGFLAAEVLLNKGVGGVLITMGSQGAIFMDSGHRFHSPAVSGVIARDPTAAGDSFVGAFCTAICAGARPEEAMAFANHTAAITVSRMGAQPSLPDMAEVLRLMAERGQNPGNWAG
ncbi:MAG: ribokinase [Christensenellales bacterium]